ncbi:hypothetical protein M885DRAFT_510511 [Pelagophyceae sp. CCMP2097]|nr:hypothetical protein M885DRAFT_510511 [Pelagophyceae sp. CCMP2097]
MAWVVVPAASARAGSGAASEADEADEAGSEADEADEDADVTALVSLRASHRRAGAYAAADELLAELQGRGFDVEDIQNGVSQYRRRAAAAPLDLPSVLDLAKRAVAATCTLADDDDAAAAVMALAAEALEVLDDAKFEAKAHLPCRKAADSAFYFAMAGAADVSLMRRLADVACDELERARHRPTIHHRHAAERLAAAGVSPGHRVFKEAARQAATQRICDAAAAAAGAPDAGSTGPSDAAAPSDADADAAAREDAAPDALSFFSPRALLWRWRYSSNIEASDSVPPQALLDLPRFFDESMPVTLDLGSGLGTSAIGLALADPKRNVLGVDCYASCVRASTGLASRHGVSDHCKFVRGSADEALRLVQEYPGPVDLICLQFPTPYSLEDSGVDVRGKANLFTSETAALVAEALAPGGRFYLSSNVEDVALRIADLLKGKVELEDSPLEATIDYATAGDAYVTRRAEKWAAETTQRCAGPPWLVRSPLPSVARTETEAVKHLLGLPVHRAVWVKPLESDARQTRLLPWYDDAIRACGSCLG